MQPSVLAGIRRLPHRKAVFFFRSKLTLPEGEGPASRWKFWQETVTGGPSPQPGFFLSHCQKRKTRTHRGDPDPPHAATSVVPSLWQPHDPPPPAASSQR